MIFYGLWLRSINNVLGFCYVGGISAILKLHYGKYFLSLGPSSNMAKKGTLN